MNADIRRMLAPPPAAIAALLLLVSPAAANDPNVKAAKSLLAEALDCPVPAYSDEWSNRILDRTMYAGGGSRSLDVGIWRRHFEGSSRPPGVWGETLIAKADFKALSTPEVSANIVTLKCLSSNPLCWTVSTKEDGASKEISRSHDSFQFRTCDSDTAGNVSVAVEAMKVAAQAMKAAPDTKAAKSVLMKALDCPVPAYVDERSNRVLDRTTYAGGGDESLGFAIWRRHFDNSGSSPRAQGETLVAKAEYKALATPEVSANAITLKCRSSNPQCLTVSTREDGGQEASRSYDSFQFRACDNDTASNFSLAVEAMETAALER